MGGEFNGVWPATLTGVVRVPLVPGVERDAAALDVPVDTGLQDGSLAGVTVDTNPLWKASALANVVFSHSTTTN